MKKSIILFVTLLLLNFSFNYAQSKIDSLEKVLPTLPKDTNKLKALEETRRQYSFFDYGKSLEYAEQTLELAKELKNDDWIVLAYKKIGMTHRVMGNYEEAKTIIKKAELICNQRMDYEGLQYVYYELAAIEKRIGSLDTAFKYYQKIFSWDNKVKNHSLTARSYNSIGSLYNTKGEFDKAHSSYLKGMEIAKKYKLTSTEAYSNFNIGTMYMQRKQYENSKPFLIEASRLFDSIARSNYVAQVEMYIAVGESELGNYNEAEPRLITSKEYFEKSGNKRMLIECLQHLGVNYKFKKEYTKAEKTLQQAIKVAEEINLPDRKVAMLLNLGDVFFQNKKFNEALKTIEEGIQLNNNTRKTLNLQKDLLELQYKSEEQLNDFNAAFKSFKKFKILEDSLEQRTDDERFAQLEIEYEVEKKEQELISQKQLVESQKLYITKEKQFKTVLYAGISILFILIVSIALGYYNKQKDNRLLAAKNKIITEQTDKLKSLDQTKTKFFNNVAHELRTPLTLMSGHLESMLSNRFGGLNENQRKSILVAKRNSNRLMDLVSEILDLGKLESGKMEMKEKPVLLKPFLNRIFFTFESLAYQFDIQLQFDYQLKSSLTLMLDENKIEKVMNNLIHNAIKYTPRGGEIKFLVFQQDGHIQMAVKDNGKGINKTEQSLVFERYYQAEEPGAPAQGGTGIGLALVKEFVELHGGKVELESHPNQGSTFTIMIPEVRITKPAIITEQELLTEHTFPVYPVLEKKDKTILVVDDHKEMQQYLKEIISNYAKVIIANDGLEALDLLEKNNIDLITIDLMMPNMDGVALLKKIKQNPDYAQLPAIMLTARAAEEDKIGALQIGVNDYITKPFGQLELVARIANLIDNKMAREESLNEVDGEESKRESVDNQFVERLRLLVDANLANSEITVARLAQEMGLSDKQLTRNVKSVTGLTPLKFIREIKLLYALEQLKSNNYYTVAEVSYAIGIDNPSHFAKIFKERFGKNPSEYLS